MTSGSSGIPIPPLRETDRIEDWESLFRAAVGHIIAQGEAGVKTAVSMLPAFVCRRLVEIEVSKEAVKCDNLDSAFKLLKETLDPPVYEYEATRRLHAMSWRPGEQVDDFMAALYKQAKRARCPIRTACVTVTAQLPKEVQGKAKSWIADREEVTEVMGREFLVKVREWLTERGIATDLGYRDFDKVALISASKTSETKKEERGVLLVETREENNEEQGANTYGFGRGRGQTGARRWRGRSTTFQGPSRGACFVFQRTGHGWRYCPERVCAICRRKGHDPQLCPSRRATQNSGERFLQVRETICETCETSVMLDVMVEGNPGVALLDTGAKPSVIDAITLREFGLAHRERKNGSQVFGLGRSAVAVSGQVEVEIDIGNDQRVLQCLQVIDVEEPTFILGREFLAKFDSVEFNWNRCEIRLGDQWKRARAFLSGGTALSRSQISQDTEDDAVFTIDMDSAIEARINRDLQPEERNELRNLLQEFREIFAENPKKPSHTNIGEHTINVGDAQPKKQRPRRIPPVWEEEINKQIDEMLRNGVCRPSHSPWSSNVILAKKKDGSMRFAIDYRLLNDITKKDAYPIPYIQTILDKLEGSEYYSFFDVASAYWCVPMREEDIEKTAFSTYRGQFEMLVMPFGLCNAPGTYQRIMDQDLAKASNTESYIDDCLVYSKGFGKHLSDLRTALQGFKLANIQLHIEKCSFGYWEGRFLGHLLTRDGHQPNPDLVAKIRISPLQLPSRDSSDF